MADCELISTCVFFNDSMANMPSTCEVLKKSYCKKDFINCARHMIFEALGRAKVPPDLFPNQIDRAKDIIAEKKLT